MTGDFDLATEEYEAIVALCAEQELAVELSNRHIDHAAILTNHIIKHTENDLDIVTGSMPELFFDRIAGNVESALQKQAIIRLIFVNSPLGKCEKLLGMRAKFPNLKIFEIRDEHKENIKAKVCHFCVSDKKRFRVEDIHPDKDFTKDPSIRAIASFNHPDVARGLHQSFDKLLDISKPLDN